MVVYILLNLINNLCCDCLIYLIQLLNFDLKARKNLGGAVVRIAEKSPRFLNEEDDSDNDSSLFSQDEDKNNKLEEELEKLEEEKMNLTSFINKNIRYRGRVVNTKRRKKEGASFHTHE